MSSRTLAPHALRPGPSACPASSPQNSGFFFLILARPAEQAVPAQPLLPALLRQAYLVPHAHSPRRATRPICLPCYLRRSSRGLFLILARPAEQAAPAQSPLPALPRHAYLVPHARASHPASILIGLSCVLCRKLRTSFCDGAEDQGAEATFCGQRQRLSQGPEGAAGGEGNEPPANEQAGAQTCRMRARARVRDACACVFDRFRLCLLRMHRR